MAERTRREVLGLGAMLVASALAGAEEEGYALLDRSYRFAADVTIKDLPVPGILRPIVPDIIKTHAHGVIGHRTGIDLPMPGILPDYHMEGGIDGGRLSLRIERGALENRLLLATIEPEGTISELGIYHANKQWKKGKMTIGGGGRIAGNAPELVFRPLDPNPDFDEYALSIFLDAEKIHGRFEGRKKKPGQYAHLFLSFEGECREA